jgi:hypothetical protein
MMTASIRDAERVPVVRVGKAVRLAIGLLALAGVVVAALFLRYAAFEYFHGGGQTLRALWHALGL